MYLSFYNTNLRKGIIEICLLLTIFYLFDPLLSFAIYFCFVHTYKHLNHLIKMIFTHLENKKFVIYTTILFTIISWIAGLYIIYFLSINFSIYESFIKVIFIGLAALTLPHMILVDLVYRKKFNNYLN